MPPSPRSFVPRASATRATRQGEARYSGRRPSGTRPSTTGPPVASGWSGSARSMGGFLPACLAAIVSSAARVA